MDLGESLPSPAEDNWREKALAVVTFHRTGQSEHLRHTRVAAIVHFEQVSHRAWLLSLLFQCQGGPQ